MPLLYFWNSFAPLFAFLFPYPSAHFLADFFTYYGFSPSQFCQKVWNPLHRLVTVCCFLFHSIFTYFIVARIRCIRRQSVVCQEIQSLYLQICNHLLAFVVSVYTSNRADRIYGERLHRLLFSIYRWLCQRHALVSWGHIHLWKPTIP